MSGGCTLMGIAIGFVGSYIFKITSNYPVIEPMFIFCTCYISYLLAELVGKFLYRQKFYFRGYQICNFPLFVKRVDQIPSLYILIHRRSSFQKQKSYKSDTPVLIEYIRQFKWNLERSIGNFVNYILCICDDESCWG